ncbi:MAG: hypothetical protein IPK83_21435 [Planctomycetes bacterium]|nr:hypothetical protein [Planctomycetota bacterium]
MKEHAIGLLILAIIANAWHWFLRTPVSLCFDVIFSIVGLYLLTRLTVHVKRRSRSIVLNHDTIITIVDGRTKTWPLDTIKNVERYSFFPKLLLHDGSWLALTGVFDSSGEWLTFARLLLNFKAGQFDGIEAVVEEFRKPANLPVWTINKWPMRRRPLTPRQKKAQRMSYIGLGILVLAYLVFLPILLGMNPGKEPPIVALTVLPAIYGGDSLPRPVAVGSPSLRCQKRIGQQPASSHLGTEKSETSEDHRPASLSRRDGSQYPERGIHRPSPRRHDFICAGITFLRPDADPDRPLALGLDAEFDSAFIQGGG